MATGICFAHVHRLRSSIRNKVNSNRSLKGVGKRQKRRGTQEPKSASNRPPSDATFASSTRWLEFCGLVALFALTVFFVATSWRKWPDPLIDIGRELYVPWRLAHGAVLYHDVSEQYGPLSQYFNAALFRCFGPGLMVLVWANLIIFAGIIAALYWLCRQAWGAFAAFVACTVFIAVFGFSQFVPAGNYNYATPYAHETTHGFLVCLLLALALTRWKQNSTLRWSFISGFLFGLTTVLKPEFMLAGGLVTLAAALIGSRKNNHSILGSMTAWVAGALLPTVGFIIFFLSVLPWKEALSATCHAWLGWVTASPISALTNNPVQMGFTGLNQPASHLMQHLWVSLLACSIVIAIAGIARFVDRTDRFWPAAILTATSWTGAIVIAVFVINWREIGRCVFGLIGTYALVRAAISWRSKGGEESQSTLRFLLAVLASTLMVRMALNGRVYQYGFYQAALASVLIPAILLAELPEWLRLTRRGRTMIVVTTLALLVPGVTILAVASQQTLRLKTAAVGEGLDRFYAFPRQIEATGELVQAVSAALRHTDPEKTLLVLPEGLTINYLTRLRNPVPDFFFPDLNEQFLNSLEGKQPDLIVLVSRDLREYGVQRYGGDSLVPWLEKHYTQVAHFRGNPLDYRQHGAVILRRVAPE